MTNGINEALILEIKIQIDKALANLKTVNSSTKKSVDTQLSEENRKAKEKKRIDELIIQNFIKNNDKQIKEHSRAIQQQIKEQEKAAQQQIRLQERTLQQQAKEREKAFNRQFSDLIRQNERELKEIASFNAKRQAMDAKTIQRNKQSMYDNLFQAQSGKPISWQSQIGDFAKLNPLIIQQAKLTEQAEKQKQKAMEATAKVQARLALQQQKTQDRQQQSIFSKIKNAILPGFGAGIGMAGVMAGVQAINALKNAIGRGVEFNSMKEASTAMFKVMLKDGPMAVKLMDDLQAKALSTSMNFEEAIKSSKQLLAYGFKYGEVVSTMSTLGTVVAATGGKLDDLAYVYGTLRTQGKAYTRDLMQFAMRGIPIYEELAKVMGVTAIEMLKMVKSGDVDIMFSDVEKAFQRMTSRGGVFYGASEARLKTLAGMQEQLVKNTDIMLGKIGEAFAPMMKMAVETLTTVVSIIANVADFYSRGLARFNSMTSGGIKESATQKAISGQTSGNANIANETLTAYIKTFTRQIMMESIIPYYDMTNTKMQRQIDLVAQYAQNVGASMKDTATVMMDAGLITREAFIEIGKIAQNNAILAQDTALSEKDASDTMNYGELGKIIEKLGISAGAYANSVVPQIKSAGKYVKPSASRIADQTARSVAIEKLATEAKKTEVDSAKVIELYKTTNKAELDMFQEKAKRLGRPEIADLAMKTYQTGIENAIATTTAVLSDTYLSGKAKTEWENILVWLLDQAKLDDAKLNDKVAGVDKSKSKSKSKKIGDIKFGPLDDPKIWEDIIPTLTFTELDDAGYALEKRIAEITKAYGRQPALYEKRDLAIKAETDAYNRLGTAIIDYERAMKNAGTSLVDAQMAEENGSISAGFIASRLQLEQDNANRTFEFYKSIKDKAYGEERDLEIIKFNKEMELINLKFNNESKLKMINNALGKNGTQFSDNLMKQAGESLEYVKNIPAMESYSKIMNPNGTQTDYSMEGIGKLASAGISAGIAQATQGTDLGSALSEGGGQNMLVSFASKLIGAVASIENVSKSLNFLDTIINSFIGNISDGINHMLQPVINLVEMFGVMLGQLVSPFVTLVDTVITLAYSVAGPLMGAIQIVTGAFQWLSDSLITYMLNPLIRGINGFLTGINNALGFLNVHIPLLSEILTSTAKAQQDTTKEYAEMVLGLYGDAMSYLRDKIKSQVDKTVDALQQMYEVGAISATEYERKSKDAYKQVPLDDKTKAMFTQFPQLEQIANDGNITQLLEAYTAMSAGKADLEGKIKSGVYTVDDVNNNITATNGILERIAIAVEATQALQVQVAKTYEVNTGSSGYSQEMQRQWEQVQAQAMQNVKDNANLTATTGIGAYSKDMQIQWEQAQATQAMQNVRDSANLTATTGVGAYSEYMSKQNAIQTGDWTAYNLKYNTPKLATGTNYVPNDMIAQLHKGEMVVPKAYVPTSDNNGGGVNVYVTVSGSVTAENDLANTIVKAIYKNRKMGVSTI